MKSVLDFVGGVAAIATILAALVGGIWYFARLEDRVADLEATLQALAVTEPPSAADPSVLLTQQAMPRQAVP